MRHAHAVIASMAAKVASSLRQPRARRAAAWIIVLVLIAGFPGAAWAVPQNADDNDPPAGAGDSGVATTSESESESKAEAEAGQESTAPQAEGRVLGTVQVQGAFEIGFRAVDVNGAEDIYRQHYDLDEGVRLMNTRLVIRPVNRTERRLFDRATFSATGIGGDPYESWGLSAYKMGAYDVSVRSRTVDYFYDVLGDPHAWAVARNHFDARLSANVTKDFLVTANFNRFRQDGSRETTRDLVRDEFHFHEPLDQDGTTLGVGFRWRIKTTSIFFTQEFVHFNDNSGFVSGPNAGGPSNTFIEMLSHSEVRAMDAPISRGGFNTVALDNRVNVFGDFLYSDQRTGFDFVRQWEGLDRFATESQFINDNSGEAERKVRHGNLNVRVRAHDRVFVTGKYRHRDWDQEGSSIGEDVTLFFDNGDFSISRGSALSSYRVKADQFMFGGEVIPVDEFSFFAEVGFTSTDKAFDKEEFGSFPRGSDRSTDLTTETTSFRLGGVVRPDPRFDLRLTYERGDIDDPLTQISPTEADNLKFKIRVRPAPAWTVTGHATRRTVNNTISDAEFETKSFGAAVTYALDERGHATLGYTRLDWKSAIPFTFILDDRTQGESISAYDAETNVFTASAAATVSPDIPLKLYGSLAYVDNGGTVPLRRYDFAIGAKYTFPQGFFVGVQGRFLDYRQDLFHEQGIIIGEDEPSDIEDYDAKLFIVSLGFKF